MAGTSPGACEDRLRVKAGRASLAGKQGFLDCSNRRSAFVTIPGIGALGIHTSSGTGIAICHAAD